MKLLDCRHRTVRRSVALVSMLRLLLVAVALLGLVLSAQGCSLTAALGVEASAAGLAGPSPASEATLYVVILDNSGSTELYRQEYREVFSRLLGAVSWGDRIVGFNVDASSIQNAKCYLAVTLDSAGLGADPSLNDWSGNTLRQKVILQGRSDALASAHTALMDSFEQEVSCSTTGSSDLLGTVELAAIDFSSWSGRKKCFVLTDGLLENSHYNFVKKTPSEEESEGIVRAEMSEGRIPDLTGVSVYVVGAHAQSDEQFRAIAKFWRLYFTAAGAEVAAYGRLLPSGVLLGSALGLSL